VTSVTVAENQVTITFGNQANEAIDGDTLLLTAGTSTNGDVVWQCGSRAMSGLTNVTAGTTPFEGANGGGTLEQKYRPAECRG
jgi:hypothetical protein